jgi:hypothetical protein
MELRVYNKKVIDFVWENMMTSFFVADGPRKLDAPKNSVIIFSHTKSITYNYQTGRSFDRDRKNKGLV